MASQSLGPGDFEAFNHALEKVVAKASSVEEIARWLEQQPFIRSVQVMSYLRKTQPPQREILIDLDKEHIGIESTSVTVYELGPNRYQLHRLRSVSE